MTCWYFTLKIEANSDYNLVQNISQLLCTIFLRSSSLSSSPIYKVIYLFMYLSIYLFVCLFVYLFRIYFASILKWHSLSDCFANFTFTPLVTWSITHLRSGSYTAVIVQLLQHYSIDKVPAQPSTNHCCVDRGIMVLVACLTH